MITLAFLTRASVLFSVGVKEKIHWLINTDP